MGLGSQSGAYRADFSVSTATTVEVVAAVAGKRIMVVNAVVSMASGQTVIWKSAADAISGPLSASYAIADSDLGLMETKKGEALQITTSAASDAEGHLTYVLLP